MNIKLLPPKPPKIVSRSLSGRNLIDLWEYVLTRRKLKIGDLAVSQAGLRILIPFPVFTEGTCYLTPNKEWTYDEIDDNRTLLRILEHETIHHILYRWQMIGESVTFDRLFNTDPGHFLTPSDLP